jgi:hypothetical protein
MKLIARRPLLFSTLTAVALFVAQLTPGFHDW